jgi:hypothetical protein
MWFISVDGLSSCRGSMPCMWEGLIRRLIFKVRLSGPFECVFCVYFRLIIGIREWRHDMEIANMLLLRNPRGTCACGQKNGWLCIHQYLSFLRGVRSPPFHPRFFLVVPPPGGACDSCPSSCLIEQEESKVYFFWQDAQDEKKKTVFFWSTIWNKKEAVFPVPGKSASIGRPPWGVSEARFLIFFLIELFS